MADNIKPKSSQQPVYFSEDTLKNTSESNTEVDPLVDSVISQLDSERAEKIRTLTPEQQNFIEEVVFKLNELKVKYSAFTNDRSSEKQGEFLNEHNSLLLLLKDKRSKLLESDIPSEIPDIEPPSDLNFRIYEQRVLNTIANRFTFYNEIQENIIANRPLLEREFGIPQNAPTLIKFLTGEMHNKGKKTVLIGFQIAPDTIKTIVYKPRDSRIDKSVIETFRTINELPADIKSSSTMLPYYKIENLPGNKASFWEHIPGKTLARVGKIPTPAGDYVRDKHKEDTDLKKKLVRLDDVLSKMKMSDIHGENVIIKSEKVNGKEVISIVPIDLENVNVSSRRKIIPTNLRADSLRQELEAKGEWTNLSAQEQAVIDSFSAQARSLVTRYIPIMTSKLLGLTTSVKTVDSFIDLISKALKEDDFELTCDISQLKRAFIKDILLGDTPFFTEMDNKVYYGLPEDNFVIAKGKV